MTEMDIRYFPKDADFKSLRGLRNVCPDCLGSGYKLYGNTSTWRHGIGGAAVTKDVCDKCWGSGDDTDPWLSPKEVEFLRKQIKLAEQNYLDIKNKFDDEIEKARKT